MTDLPVYGQQKLSSGNSEYNALTFMIQQALAGLNVATLVQVAAVYGGGTAAVGTVDVVPLVTQVDGSGAAIPHGTIFGLPYFRYQGGSNAVIVDPQVGDVGFCLFADHDIGSVKANVESSITPIQAPPSSKRTFDFADGLYIGGWCGNLAPTSYVQVINGVINVVNPSEINLQTGGASAVLNNVGMKITGTLEVTGIAILDSSLELGGEMTSIAGGSTPINVNVPIASSSTITASGELKSGTHTLTAHTHGGVTTGGGSTSAPTG